MGSSWSVDFTPGSKNDQELNRRFDEFIQANCVRGENQYVTLNTLESAFLYFLEKNHEDFCLDLVKAGLWTIGNRTVALCRDRGFEISIGHRCLSTGLDTRHVVGLSVTQFCEKKFSCV